MRRVGSFRGAEVCRRAGRVQAASGCDRALRGQTAGEVRILFAFDPWRSSVLLVAGDKSGRWAEWYRQAIPRAEQLYATYLRERET
ncbi:type II toxin-antitoxin system RelE/ParE family toxin [Pseudonocardia oroxyli]|uniref:type II toxin-antitoxin system RelE/ParE family toxin n=1 Tax=Pseudonocardia oroxyli TaxID=366584 RepID=UPI002481DFE0|nr:type II toxin-antitoxin system RelE/ParE family toxin [Pseudonocardia oroxyli]